MSVPVRTTPEAELQIQEIDRWWRQNRTRSADLFLDELEASFIRLGDTPMLGRLYTKSPLPGMRRLLLRGSRYHVYYIPLRREVHIYAVWHARRGGSPSFAA